MRSEGASPGVFNFNSRPCGRGDSGVSSRIRTSINFNSRPCGRGDDSIIALAVSTIYFNSRPCGRGDGVPSNVNIRFKISIHAPAGGAT